MKFIDFDADPKRTETRTFDFKKKELIESFLPITVFFKATIDQTTSLPSMVNTTIHMLKLSQHDLQHWKNVSGLVKPVMI